MRTLTLALGLAVFTKVLDFVVRVSSSWIIAADGGWTVRRMTPPEVSGETEDAAAPACGPSNVSANRDSSEFFAWPSVSSFTAIGENAVLM